MTVKKLMSYCQSKPGSVLDYPFGPEPAVSKTGGKMFAVVYEADSALRISLKCESMLADFLRQQFPSVTPGYHFNKKHWNTVLCDGGIPDDEIYKQIDHSHELIMLSLSKKMRERLKQESHPLYLYPDPNYRPHEVREGDEYYPNGIFIFNITRLLEHIAAHHGDYTLGRYALRIICRSIISIWWIAPMRIYNIRSFLQK